MQASEPLAYIRGVCFVAQRWRRQ